jgi:hypothetical protein
MAGRNLYCKVFVDTTFPVGDLARMLGRHFGGVVQNTWVDLPLCIVGVASNDDFAVGRVNEGDGFLFYPVILDIEPVAGGEPAHYVAFIGDVLEFLWSNRMRAVAAADFEDDLPRRGGYNPDAPRESAS